MNKKKINEVLVYIGLVVFIVLLGRVRGIDETKYCYDSLEYFSGSRSFWNDNSFSIMNYSLSYRGIWFPLILSTYQWLGNFLGLDAWVSILVGNSIFVTCIFYYIIPGIIKKKEGLLHRIVPLLLYMMFWSDTVFYPLTDIYSLAFAVLAIYMLKKVEIEEQKWKQILYLICEGMFLYCAYNIRSIYIFIIPVILILYLLRNYKKQSKIINLCTNIVIVIIGMAILAVPQCKVNENMNDSFSPLIITDDLNGGELFTSQLYMGLIYDRYDTFIGETSEYPVPQLGLMDQSGIQIIANENISQFETIWDFVIVVLKYPFDYFGIIIRHIFNVLYLPYPSIYVKSIVGNKMFWAMLNWLLLGYFAVVIGCKKNIKEYIVTNVYYLSTLVSCVAILPGAIESRFFIPMYVFVYYTISSENIRDIFKETKGKRGKIIIAMIAFILVSLAVCGATMSSAQFIPILM